MFWAYIEFQTLSVHELGGIEVIRWTLHQLADIWLQY